MIGISTKQQFYRVPTLSNHLLSSTPKRYIHCWIAPTKWYSCIRRCCSSHITKYHSIERRDQHSKRCKLSSRSIERANIRHSIEAVCMWLSALLNPMQIRANRNNSMFNVIHITRHFFPLDVFFFSRALALIHFSTQTYLFACVPVARNIYHIIYTFFLSHGERKTCVKNWIPIYGGKGKWMCSSDSLNK